jgi:hypothetical protein
LAAVVGVAAVALGVAPAMNASASTVYSTQSVLMVMADGQTCLPSNGPDGPISQTPCAAGPGSLATSTNWWSLVQFYDGTVAFQTPDGRCASMATGKLALVDGACTQGTFRKDWGAVVNSWRLENGNETSCLSSLPSADQSFVSCANTTSWFFSRTTPFGSGSSCATPASVAVGAKVSLAPGSDFLTCPWFVVETPGSNQVVLKDEFGLCLDDTDTNADLTQNTCGLSYWTLVRGARADTVEYQSVRDSLDGGSSCVSTKFSPELKDFGCGFANNEFSFGGGALTSARNYRAGQCLGVTSTANGASAGLADACGTNSYSWTFAPGPGTLPGPVLRNTGSGMCLDSSSAQTAADTPLVQGICGNQYGGTVWSSQPGTVTGTVQYKQQKSGLCARVPTSTSHTDVGSGLVLGACDEWADFGDRVVDRVVLRSAVNSTACVDAPSGAAVGTWLAVQPTCLWTGPGLVLPTLQWTLGLTGTAGQYVLRTDEGLCADVESGKLSTGSAIVVGTCGNKYGHQVFREVSGQATGSKRFVSVDAPTLCIRLAAFSAGITPGLGVCDANADFKVDSPYLDLLTAPHTDTNVRFVSAATGACVVAGSSGSPLGYGSCQGSGSQGKILWGSGMVRLKVGSNCSEFEVVHWPDNYLQFTPCTTAAGETYADWYTVLPGTRPGTFHLSDSEKCVAPKGTSTWQEEVPCDSNGDLYLAKY